MGKLYREGEGESRRRKNRQIVGEYEKGGKRNEERRNNFRCERQLEKEGNGGWHVHTYYITR